MTCVGLVLIALPACAPSEQAEGADQNKSATRSLALKAERVLESIKGIQNLGVEDYPSAYTALMDDLAASGPLVAAHALPHLMERWAADDPAGMCRTLLEDPRCFEYQLGFSAIPVLLKDHSADLLALCQTNELRQVAAYAARFPSPHQNEILALAHAPGAPDVKSRDEITALIETDPEAALAAIKAACMKDRYLLHTYLEPLLKLVATRPEKVGKLCISLVNDRPELADQLAPVFRKWAERNPMAALDAINSINSYEAVDQLIQVPMAEWVDRQPEAAMAFAYENIQAQGIRQKVLTDLLAKWMGRDPEAASEYFFSLPETEIRTISSVFQPWIERDPERALSVISKRLNSGRSLWIDSTSHQRLIGFWADADLSAATDWAMRQPPGRAKNHYLLELVGRQADDPQKASQLVTAITEPWAYDKAAERLLSNWASTDPGAALDWMHSLPPQHRLPELEKRIYQSWAMNDPRAAAQSIPKLGDVYQEDLVKAVAQNFYQQDTPGAIQWIQSLPLKNQQQANRMVAQSMLYRKSPEEVVAFLDGLAPEAVDSGAYGMAYRKWAEREPRSAHASVLALPDGEKRNTAMITTMYGYLDAEPTAAEAWVATIEKGTADFDSASYACSLHFDKIDPLKSAYYATLIKSPERRRISFGTIFWQEGKAKRQKILDDARASGDFSEEQLQLLEKQVR